MYKPIVTIYTPMYVHTNIYVVSIYPCTYIPIVAIYPCTYIPIVAIYPCTYIPRYSGNIPMYLHTYI
jgi:hypothetical protein